MRRANRLFLVADEEYPYRHKECVKDDDRCVTGNRKAVIGVMLTGEPRQGKNLVDSAVLLTQPSWFGVATKTFTEEIG